MTDSWMTRIHSFLKKKKQNNTYRKRRSIRNGNNRYIKYNNKIYLNFSSNDYLGLSRHPKVIKKLQQISNAEGIGSGGSSYIVGYSTYHYQLEQKIANWLNFPKAILFNSGYAANQSVIYSLMKSGDFIFADKLSHASLMEASLKSHANFKVFTHNDPNSLNYLINKYKCYSKNFLVITEGIFSMDGDQSPLSDILYITKKSGGWLLVDDAHGIGVIGKEGKGCTYNLKDYPNLLVITFGKAIGANGAAVLCTVPVAEYLIQCSRNLIYSTSLPSAQVAAISKSLDIIKESDDLRYKLLNNINYFKYKMINMGFKLLPSNSAIQPIVIKDNLLTLKLAKYLRKRGLWLTAILPPTVPSQESRLRITITANHSSDDIDTLIEALYDAKRIVLQK